MAEPVIPPGIDPQDPLPEGKWFWRRLIVFATVAASYWLLWSLTPRVPAADVRTVMRDLMILIGVLLLFYLVAPSANQITELLATLKLRLRGPRRDGAEAPDCDPPDRDRGGRGDRRDDRNTRPPLPPRRH